MDNTLAARMYALFLRSEKSTSDGLVLGPKGPLDGCRWRNRIHLCLPFALHLMELQWTEQSTQGSTSPVLRQDDSRLAPQDQEPSSFGQRNSSSDHRVPLSLASLSALELKQGHFGCSKLTRKEVKETRDNGGREGGNKRREKGVLAALAGWLVLPLSFFLPLLSLCF